MKKHVKIYLDYFEIGEQDAALCEVCKRRGVDIHHIEAKGMGGSKTKDYIENLMLLCRRCHQEAHAGIISKSSLKTVHKYRMIEMDKPINYKLFGND